MSSAICLNQKPKDAEMDIAPQMKKMKLNNSNSSAPESDIIMSNLTTSDPLENLKTAFPSISENLIKEILDKSDNNIEGAKQLISEFKQKQFLNNPNNLNFHQSNRKRRYETAFLNNNSNINNTDSAMNATSVSSFSNANGLFSKNNNSNANGSSNSTNSVLSNPFANSNLMGSSANSAMPERRIIKFNNKIYPFNNANISLSNFVAANGNNANNNVVNNNLRNNNNNNNINFNSSVNLNNGFKGVNNSFNFNNNPKINENANFFENNFNTNTTTNSNSIDNDTEVLNDQALENLLAEVGQYKTKDDIKAYLKNKITGLIKVSANKPLTIQTTQTTNRLTEVERNLNSSPIEKVDAEKITLLEKNLNSLESNNKQLKQLICTIYRKYENSQETIQNAKKKFEELDKENIQLKMEKESLEIALMQEKTDHNILKEFIRQFDDSKGYCLPDTRHIY